MATESLDALPEVGAPLARGTRLGKYEIVRLLGAGGMGAVYEAVHSQIGKRVAIKVLSHAVIGRPGARARFQREARLTSKVNHPHAVDVTDMGTDGDQTYLIMELLTGEDLGARLTRVGRLDPADLVDIVLPVCSAVAAAHEVGITHRDLKPQNIFLATGAHGLIAKVLDFGISKLQDPSLSALTSTGALLGTPMYLAPEQAVDNRAAGPASDQYALGIILYECVTGVRPFARENLFATLQAIVAGSPPPPRQHRPDLDPALQAVVLRAIDVEPTRRFSSVRELASALLPFAGERGRLLWGDTFGTKVATGRPARVPMPVDTAVDSAPRAAAAVRNPPLPSWLDADEPVNDTVRPRNFNRVVAVAVGLLIAIGVGVLLNQWKGGLGNGASPVSTRSRDLAAPIAAPVVAAPPAPVVAAPVAAPVVAAPSAPVVAAPSAPAVAAQPPPGSPGLAPDRAPRSQVGFRRRRGPPPSPPNTPTPPGPQEPRQVPHPDDVPVID